jgi:hypothetical protein
MQSYFNVGSSARRYLAIKLLTIADMGSGNAARLLYMRYVTMF